MKMETRQSKPVGFSKSISKKRISSKANLPEEIRKISNKQPNFKFKVYREKNNKTQSSQKERKHKDQSINK